MVLQVTGGVPWEYLIVSTRNLPMVDAGIRDKLKELVKNPGQLCQWYKGLTKNHRLKVCTQLDLWSREREKYGPQDTWRVVSVVIHI